MGELVLDNPSWQAIYDPKTDRILGRLKKDTDLFTGIKEICQQFGVSAGQFQCMGSLQYATFRQVIKGKEEGTITYSPKIHSTSEVELLSGTGFIGIDAITRELEVHFHGIFIDCYQQINGGHFLEHENKTAITIEYIIFPVYDALVSRQIDEKFKVPFFQFKEKRDN